MSRPRDRSLRRGGETINLRLNFIVVFHQGDCIMDVITGGSVV